MPTTGLEILFFVCFYQVKEDFYSQLHNLSEVLFQFLWFVFWQGSIFPLLHKSSAANVSTAADIWRDREDGSLIAPNHGNWTQGGVIDQHTLVVTLKSYTDDQA